MAMVGSVAESKQIQLSKAASIFTRFAATTTVAAGSRGVAAHAKAAYLRLASKAFDELLELQTEVCVVEKAKKKRGKRSRRSVEDESEDGDVEAGEVVDSNMKRRRIDDD